MPLIVPNVIALGQTMYYKSVTIFLHPSVFSRPEGPRDQSSPISALIYSKARTTNVPNFVPFDNLSTRHLLPNFDDFVESVTDKNDKTRM